MQLNRRQFVANSTVFAAGVVATSVFGAAPSESTGQTLSPTDIQADHDLRHVYKAVTAYGRDVHMTRRGAQVMVRTRIHNFDAFRDCYTTPGLAEGPVRALSGNRIAFKRNRVEFVLDHLAA
jgi:hypothetical protein